MSSLRWQEPNLARAPFVNERPVRRLAVALWLLFAIVGGTAFWMSRTLRQETGTRLADLVRLNTESVNARGRAVTLEQELRAADLPAQNERAEFLNRRLAERSFSWSGLLEKLSQTMPRGVRLMRLSPEGFVRERGKSSKAMQQTAATTRVALRITGEAEETEALLEFVDRLFVHPAFDRPNLSRETEKKDLKIQFELTVGYLPQTAGEPSATAALPPGDAPRAGSGAAAPGPAGRLSGVTDAAPGAGAGVSASAAAPVPSPAGAAAASRRLPAPPTDRRAAGRASGSLAAPSGDDETPAPAATPSAAAVDRSPWATGEGGFAGVPVAPASGIGGGTGPGVAVPPPIPGAKFPANVMPTPLRPYASTSGGGR